MKVGKIQAALTYVHYWEATERGTERKSRASAAKEAIKHLNPDEITILLNAIHVKLEEVK